MKPDELESILEGAAETPTVDFKAACSWNVSSFAKDILAMCNVQDGGYIIVGIQDGVLTRQGVTAEIRDSYKIDVMRDQMASFADPHVNFFVEYPKDRSGMEFVLVRVLPFEEIPVICRKDSPDTKAGTIYYRNRNRRVESAAVSNSYDMREIINLAVVRMMQKYKEYGFTVEPSAKRRLDEELKGL